MKVFRSEADAEASAKMKEHFFLNGYCPHTKKGKKLCGNWCAKFYLNPAGKNTSAHVIMGCKVGEKLLFVEEIIGEKK